MLTSNNHHNYHHENQGVYMANKDQFQGKWNEVKGKVKQNWGKLTDDDITQINGKRLELLGKLQSRYGYAKRKPKKSLPI